jgi:hypothetical protein
MAPVLPDHVNWTLPEDRRHSAPATEVSWNIDKQRARRARQRRAPREP